MVRDLVAAYNNRGIYNYARPITELNRIEADRGFLNTLLRRWRRRAQRRGVIRRFSRMHHFPYPTKRFRRYRYR